MTELDLMWRLISAIPFAIPDCRPFRRSVVNVQSTLGFRARAGVKGQADLQLIFRGGRILEVECKAARGILSKPQLAWQEFCRSWSIPHIVLTAQAGETPAQTITRWLEEIQAAMPEVRS